MSRARTGTLLVFALLIAGCVNLSTDPNEIVAIEFSPLPWPAVVAGDTLRDESGAATPLGGKLINAEGSVVTTGTISFATADSLVTISPDGYLVGKSDALGVARLIASGAGLQSITRQVNVVPPPDALIASGTTDTLRLILPDDPTADVSTPVAVRLQSHALAAGVTGVNGWIVRFHLSYQGVDLAENDSSSIYLVNEANIISFADTTDATGSASRRIRFKVQPGNVPALDSLIVVAEARYRGALVSGAPVRMVVPVKPK